MVRTLEDMTNEAVKAGGIFSVLYFDMHADDKEKLKQLAVDFATKITQEHGVLYAQAEIDSPIEYEGSFSTNTDVYVLTQNFSALMNLAIRFGPIGVEILKPDNHLRLSMGEAHDLLLNAAQNSLEFSKFVLNRISNDDQKAEFNKDMARRAEMGKRLIEKLDAKKAEKAEKKGE